MKYLYSHKIDLSQFESLPSWYWQCVVNRRLRCIYCRGLASGTRQEPCCTLGWLLKIKIALLKSSSKEFGRISTIMIIFAFFSKLYVMIILCRIPNQCPKRVIRILKENYPYGRVGSLVPMTFGLKTAIFLRASVLRYERDT